MSKPQRPDGQPIAARQALPPSVRMFRLHVWPCGQYWLTGLLKSLAMPYSNCLPGIRYGPKTVTSTPILPALSSIQYACSVWPPLNSFGTA